MPRGRSNRELLGEQPTARRVFCDVEYNYGVIGMLLGGVLIVVAMIAGVATFGDLAGIGLAYGVGIGLICAVCPGGTGPTFCDPANVRNHWRGHLQVAAAIVLLGAVGAGASAVLL